MMHVMTPLDMVIIVAYMIGMLGIGVWSVRRY